MTDESESVPADVHRDVMEATYRTICDRGYASTTIREIAAEAGKSPSLLHYHYDTKEALLVAFLEYLVEEFESQLELPTEASAAEQLEILVEDLLAIKDNECLNRALLELRAQAPYRDEYRRQLRRTKTALKEHLADVVADGIDSGEFREVDPETTARFVLAAIDGARSFYVAHDDDDDPEAVRRALGAYIDGLRADGGD